MKLTSEIHAVSRSRLGELVAALALGGLLLAVIGGTGPKVVDLDIWHEMALARELFTRGHLPSVDVFAYTPTVSPVIHHEWGTGVIVYVVARVFGAAGILGLNYLVLFAAIALVAAAARIAGAELQFVLLAVPLPILLLATGFSPFRAQAFSVLFFSLLLYCLARDRRGERRWIWVWIPAFIVWANLHGGCVLAIGVLLLESLERRFARQRWVHLVAVAGATVAALSCTPYGLGYYGYLFRALTMHRPAINEWMPLWRQPATPLIWGAIALCLCCVVYVVVAARRRVCAGAFTVAVMAVGAVLRVKLLDFFAVAFIASVPVLVRLTAAGELVRRTRSWRQFWTATSFGVAVMSLLLLTHVQWWELRVPGQPFGPMGFAYPVGPVGYMQQERFTGNVFAPFDSGAYVSWRLFPSVRVAADSRYEVAYPPDLIDEVFEFYYGGGAGWEKTLSKYATDLVIVPRSSLAAHRMPECGWRLCYRDSAFDVYGRPGLKLPVFEEHRKEIWGTLP